MTHPLIQARVPVDEALQPILRDIEQQLGLQFPAHKKSRDKLRAIGAKIPAAAIAALVQAGYAIVPPGSGDVDVQAMVTGTFGEAPFACDYTVTVRIGKAVFWTRERVAHHPPPFDGLCGYVLDNIAGRFREEMAPLVAVGLSELGKEAFRK